MPNSRVYKRGDVKDKSIWWAKWWDADAAKWVRRSTGLTDRKAAEQWLAQREREVISPTPKKARAPFSEALTRIICDTEIESSTKKMYTDRAERLMESFGADFDLYDLSEVDVMKHIHRRLEVEKVSRSTVYKEWLTLKVAAQKMKADIKLPAFSNEYVPRKRWLTFEEYRTLCVRLPEKRAMWLTLACYTGGRYGEVCRLDWSDIDWQQGIVWVRGTKTTGSDRFVPMPPALRQALLMFGVKERGAIVGEWKKVNRDLNKIADALKMEHVSPNDLRRTYASWLRNRGVELGTIAHLLGHASLTMVYKTYGKLSQNTLEQAALMLPGHENSHKQETDES